MSIKFMIQLVITCDNCGKVEIFESNSEITCLRLAQTAHWVGRGLNQHYCKLGCLREAESILHEAESLPPLPGQPPYVHTLMSVHNLN